MELENPLRMNADFFGYVFWLINTCNFASGVLFKVMKVDDNIMNENSQLLIDFHHS